MVAGSPPPKHMMGFFFSLSLSISFCKDTYSFVVSRFLRLASEKSMAAVYEWRPALMHVAIAACQLP